MCLSTTINYIAQFKEDIRKAFNVIALDKNFQIVSLLRFTNLQWNRKYYEAGNFSIRIPIEQYSSDIMYIYTKDRPELGKVTQLNYVEQDRYKYMQLSGYFLEKTLDRHVCYPQGTSNITNSPSWVFSSGFAEDVAFAYFNGFKTIAATTGSSVLDIQAGISQRRGKQSIHYRNGENLGYKIYDILKPSEMSCRVLYDFVDSIKKFECWSGLDRTEGNADGNNPVIFSTKYGNIKNPNILIEENSYKNACIMTNEQLVNDVSTFTSQAVFNVAIDDSEVNFLYQKSALNAGDYTASELQVALQNEGMNAVQKFPKTFNVEFDAMAGSYEYGTDFDLGDKVSIEVPEINFSVQARLIGCYEVMKSGQWIMTMEFGTPIINKK